MKSYYKILNLGLVIVLTGVLSACGARESEYSISAMQSKDKNIGCREIKLEINEAEFLRKQALRSKRMGVTDVVNPLGYMSEYSSAGEAADAADTRIKYLQRIYEINGCNELRNRQSAPVYPHHYNDRRGYNEYNYAPNIIGSVEHQQSLTQEGQEMLSFHDNDSEMGATKLGITQEWSGGGWYY